MVSFFSLTFLQDYEQVHFSHIQQKVNMVAETGIAYSANLKVNLTNEIPFVH